MKLVKVAVEESKVFEQQNNNGVLYCTFITEPSNDTAEIKNNNVYLVSDNCMGGTVITTANGKEINYFIDEHVNRAKNSLRERRADEFKQYDLIRLNIIDSTPMFIETQEEKQARLQWFENYKSAPNNMTISNAFDWQTAIPIKPSRLQAMFELI